VPSYSIVARFRTCTEYPPSTELSATMDPLLSAATSWWRHNNNITVEDATTAAASAAAAASTASAASAAPEWMYQFVDFRKRLFLRTVEPIIVTLLGPVVADDGEEQSAAPQRLFSPCAGGFGDDGYYGGCGGYYRENDDSYYFYGRSSSNGTAFRHYAEAQRRRLGFLPEYVSNVKAFKETSMSFATLVMLFVTLSCVFLIFLSCFYHNQKTSPLFISPRRHRLPRLVPPPLPVDGYFSWVKSKYVDVRSYNIPMYYTSLQAIRIESNPNNSSAPSFLLLLLLQKFASS